jgi:2-oxoisovalerate ferredoxin oxidoreductase beta subunit
VYRLAHSKPAAFFDHFARKGGDLDDTHYCPGCGHGVLHKLIAEAIADFGIGDRTILVNPVGCAVFAHWYLDVGNVQAAHGRAPAVAAGIKRVRPEAVVIAYQGDGDLAAIGGNEILHAANRGENIAVFFVNNGIYGMTGGQTAPTTPLGARTVTSPRGRSAAVEGYPLRMCELLATLTAPAYIERVALTDGKHHMSARRAVRRALRNQIEGRGFSFVEVLAACPTGWSRTPVEAVDWIAAEMIPAFPLGVFRARDDVPAERAAEPPAVSETEESQPRPSGGAGAIASGSARELALLIGGSGGHGVLFLGAVLADAGMREGLEVTWLPSYGPEMRGGTAHCHVRVALEPIASPIVTSPNVVLALNEASLARFAPELAAGGMLVVDATTVRSRTSRSDVTVLEVPATAVARDLGNVRVANMVLLGAYLEESQALDPRSVAAALAAQGLAPELQRLDERALAIGRGLAVVH